MRVQKARDPKEGLREEKKKRREKVSSEVKVIYITVLSRTGPG